MASLSDLYTHLKTLCEQWFYTKSQMDTSLSGKASSTHTHGNISNDGKITTRDGNVLGYSYFPIIALENGSLIQGHIQTGHIYDSFARTNIGTSANSSLTTIMTAIDTKLGELVDINFVTVVQTLPTASASTMGKIYLVPITGSGTNNYAEYVTVKDGSTYSWEKFGEVSGSGLSVDWSDITSKPSTYPPSSHTHNNISNDGKVTATGTNGGNLVVTNSSNQVIVESSINVLDGVVQQLITYGSS